MRSAAFLALLPGVVAHVSAPPVSVTSTLAGAEVNFPKAQVDRAGRILEEDGGYLDLARSKDGHRLWVRRAWDDGSADVTRFDLDPPGRGGGVLQFVDGIVEAKGATFETSMGQDRDPMARSYREGGRWFVQHLEAWVVDVGKQRISRPSTAQVYPLVPARAPGSAATTPARVQWMAFVPSCPEAKSGCVYFGDPEEVCGRYVAHTTPEMGQQLWIAPRGKNGCPVHAGKPRRP